MKFEKSFFKPKQMLTAAALNRIEDTLATIADAIYLNDEVIFNELLPLFDNADCIITSEDTLVTLTAADGDAYNLINMGFEFSVNKSHNDIQPDSFDAIMGCKYDDVKYYCKPIVFMSGGMAAVIIGNLKALYDFYMLQGETESAQIFQDIVSKAGFTLDIFENLPFICSVDLTDGAITLINVENGNITESFGSHTFEIISSIPPEFREIIPGILVIDKLPSMSENVFVQGLNLKTGLKLLQNDSIPVIIDGKLFNMSFSDCYADQLPDGSGSSFIYLASAVDVSNDTLHDEIHYFTDAECNGSLNNFIIGSDLIYRGSRTIKYDLSSLREQ